MYLYFSPILLLCVIISLFAQIRVERTFNEYSRMMASRGYTASQVARMILDQNHLHHVRIEFIRGHLSDHFDPRQNVIRLSESVYHSSSVAAIGVAAHECGHAVQYAEEYKPIVIRNAIVKSTNICSRLSFVFILIGMLLSLIATEFAPIASLCITLGIIAFSVTTLFQLITLPVEFNASRRAMETITSNHMLTESEQDGAQKVLKAAAMTYVAALIVSLLQLLRLIIIFRRRN